MQFCALNNFEGTVGESQPFLLSIDFQAKKSIITYTKTEL